MATPWTAAHQSPLSFTVYQSLLKFMSIESMMPSNHLILCCPLLLLPSIFSSIRVFSSELVLRIRWPKYQHFSFSISLYNEYSVLISFRKSVYIYIYIKSYYMNKFCFKACFCRTLLRPKGNSNVYFRKQAKFRFFKKRVNKLNTWKDKALKKIWHCFPCFYMCA